MRLASVARLRCPCCLRDGVEAAFEPDPTRLGGREDGGTAGELLEAFLVCARCRAARPLLAGVAVVVADLAAHLRDHGNVYRRAPIGDPRVTRFVLRDAGTGGDVVPFAEVVARYGDLLPPADDVPPAGPDPWDRDLDAALVAHGARGPALEVGCGVGRGVFVLAARTGDATGADRSVARVRRARNVKTADEFRLPRQPGARVETPIDLARLVRAPVDLVVADPVPLPFASGTFATVVLRRGDGDGPFPDLDAARREARRVVARDGLLLVEREGADGVRLERLPTGGRP